MVRIKHQLFRQRETVHYTWSRQKARCFVNVFINQLEWTSTSIHMQYFFDQWIFSLQVYIQRRLASIIAYSCSYWRYAWPTKFWYLPINCTFFIVKYLFGEWFWPKTLCSHDLRFYGWIIKWVCLKRRQRPGQRLSDQMKQLDGYHVPPMGFSSRLESSIVTCPFNNKTLADCSGKWWVCFSYFCW